MDAQKSAIASRDIDALTNRIKTLEAAKRAEIDAAVAAATRELLMKLDEVCVCVLFYAVVSRRGRAGTGVPLSAIGSPDGGECQASV